MQVDLDQLEPWQIRVVAERKELDEKILALVGFTSSKTWAALTSSQQTDLRDQLYIMRRYSDILERRIKKFGPEEIAE